VEKLKIELEISQRVCSSLDDQVRELKNRAGEANREMFLLKNRVSISEGEMSGHLSFTATDFDLNDKIQELQKQLASSEKVKAESLCHLDVKVVCDAKRAEYHKATEIISNLMRAIKGEVRACQTELRKETTALRDLQAELDKLCAADASSLQKDLRKALRDHEKLKKELE